MLVAAVAARPQTKPFSTDPPDTHPQYFPKDSFANDPDSSDFEARWYAKHLRAMAEPSLLDASKDRTVVAYRFLWLRTFHHPIAVRLTIRPDGTASLVGKETTGQGGYKAGVVSVSKSSEVSALQVQEFLRLLQEATFWSSRTKEDAGGDDGAEWILEGVRDGTYLVVDRWSPKTGDYRNLCLFLLKLAGIKVEAKDVY